jgi:hypothetical protein
MTLPEHRAFDKLYASECRNTPCAGLPAARSDIGLFMVPQLPPIDGRIGGALPI